MRICKGPKSSHSAQWNGNSGETAVLKGHAGWVHIPQFINSSGDSRKESTSLIDKIYKSMDTDIRECGKLSGISS
jgi:hypothetical protein